MTQTAVPEPPGFAELTKAEQILYLQELWDRIAERPGEFPAPESHLTLAEERLAEYRRNPQQARSAFELLDRLASKQR